MSPREIFALRDYLSPELKGRTLCDARQIVSLTNILEQTCLYGGPRELSGRSVLLNVTDQLMSALAMIEIDGVARRMLLCPPNLKADQLKTLIDDAEIDAVVTDQPARWTDSEVYLVVAARPPVRAGTKARTERATEPSDRCPHGAGHDDVPHAPPVASAPAEELAMIAWPAAYPPDAETLRTRTGAPRAAPSCRAALPRFTATSRRPLLPATAQASPS